MSKPVLNKLLPPNFSDKLIEYRKREKQTLALSLVARGAEDEHKKAYAKQAELMREIVEIWKAHRSVCVHSELFRLPDGTIVRVENGIIWFEPVTPLQ